MDSADNDREQIVSSLCTPDAYPHASNAIEHIETHISDVFLVGEFAYKVKKPIDFGFCDFSTSELRRTNTYRELELNQRLTEGVYLSLESLQFDDDSGTYRVVAPDATGTELEAVLKMRRLNSSDRLDRMLDEGRAGTPEVKRLARTLAQFHRDAPQANREFATFEKISDIVIGNIERVREHGGEFLDFATLADIEGFSRAFLQNRKSEFDNRHRAGSARECHGDLHAGNVFLESVDGEEPKIQIIDCIEFNDDLVNIDPAADIAFLSMDLKRRGMNDLADELIASYLYEAGDPGIEPLLPFYESYRATVRCLAASISAKQTTGSARDSHVEDARSYLELACGIAAKTRPISLIVTAGLTGSGKSTVALMIARQWKAEHLQTDVIRKELAGLGPLERTQNAVRKGIYSPEMSKKTYEMMRSRASKALASGRSVVMDGVHLKRSHRQESINTAITFGALTAILECSLDERQSLERLKTRYESSQTESEGRPEIYLSQRPEWEPVSQSEADTVVKIDSGLSQQNIATHTFSCMWQFILR